jgi:hypothetical protein
LAWLATAQREQETTEAAQVIADIHNLPDRKHAAR